MPNITLAYQWAVRICNAENVGYSQAYRNGQTVNGVTYYDCSSFIYFALIAGGFPLDPNTNAFTTYTMGATLIKLGFKVVPIGSAWKAGDVLLRSGHTEMVYAGRRTMGAHSDDRALQDQVSINTYEASVSSWTTCYRYGGGATANLDWVKGNRYLSEEEMQNNACIVYSDLLSRGWSLNAIAGILGNMESESNINPALWQSLDYGNMQGGYGLVQWTPASNYITWATYKGYDITDGNKQIQWIDEETTNAGQWIATSLYNFSFETFKTSNEEPEYLASAFLKNFERAGVEVEEKRRTQARKWYDFLLGLDIFVPVKSSKRKGYNFLLFNKNRRKQQCKNRIF